MAHANSPVNQKLKQDDPPLMQSPAQSDAKQGPSLPQVLAVRDDNDCYFDIKLMKTGALRFRNEPVHELRFKLSLARPFVPSQRIQSAEVRITLSSNATNGGTPGPEIVAINPESTLIDFVDLEQTTNSSWSVTGGSPPTAPASLSATANFSRGDKTSFKGSKLFHGWIQEPKVAKWKMYEEPRSKSGLSPLIDLLLLVKSSAAFTIAAEVSVNRSCGWRSFWSVKSVKANRVNVARIPDNFEAPPEPDNSIADFLQQGEARLKELEEAIDTNFPNLNLAAIYGSEIGVLMLEATQGDFKPRQFVVPRSPQTVEIGSASLSASPDTGAVHLENVGNAPRVTIDGNKVSPRERIKLEAGCKIAFAADIAASDQDSEDDDQDSTSDDDRSLRPHTEPNHHYAAAKVIFAGYPKDAPKGSIDARVIDRAVRRVSPQAKRRIGATKKKVHAEIEARFTVWNLSASTPEQLKTVVLLNELVNLRLVSLNMDTIPPIKWIHQDDTVDQAAGDESRKSIKRVQSPRRDRDDSVRRLVMSAAALGGVGPMMGRQKPLTGEEALANHRTVGGAWKESRV